MLAYERKVRDRNPEIRAAGKVVPPGEGAGQCLASPPTHPPTPEHVRKFRAMSHPGPGQQRSFAALPRGEGAGPDRNGVQTKASLAAGELVNPLRKTDFQQLLLSQQESLYASKRTAPIGCSHDQAPGLPVDLDPAQTTFGRPVSKGESAGSIVNPLKSSSEIERESEEGRELYRRSHNAWGVGEMVDRDYDWSEFSRESLYGVPTPHQNSGRQVRDAMHWLCDAQSAKKASLVSKRLDDFRERTQPQLAKVHDPIAETLDVPADHSFGVLVKPDECNAGELIHMEGPSSYLLSRAHLDTGILSSIRHHLKKNNFHGFRELLSAFVHKDQGKSGCVTFEDVREICFQFNVPLTPDMLELLLAWCQDSGPQGEAPGGVVQYQLLLQLINWKQPLTSELTGAVVVGRGGEGEEGGGGTGSGAGAGAAKSPLLLSNYRASSQMISATPGAPPTQGYQTHGVPTVRSDRPAPRIRRVGDLTNYGDESDAYGLIYPSLYSNKGIYAQDLFAPRPPEEIRAIFSSLGVEMSDEVFQELWREAVRRDPQGQVSVESMRALMEEAQQRRSC